MSKEWYYRENKDSALVGPMSYRDANAGARHLSQMEDHSGLAEVVVRLGTRAGDPQRTPVKTTVVFMYIRGRQTLGGRTAQYHSDHGLPPTT